MKLRVLVVDCQNVGTQISASSVCKIAMADAEICVSTMSVDNEYSQVE